LVVVVVDAAAVAATAIENLYSPEKTGSRKLNY